MTVIEESPNSFNVNIEVNILIGVRLSLRRITSCKVVIRWTLPNCQKTISHSDVIIRIIASKSGNKVPRSIFTVWHSHRVVNQESSPETITIFLKVCEIRIFLIMNWSSRIKSVGFNFICWRFYSIRSCIRVISGTSLSV